MRYTIFVNLTMMLIIQILESFNPLHNTGGRNPGFSILVPALFYSITKSIDTRMLPPRGMYDRPDFSVDNEVLYQNEKIFCINGKLHNVEKYPLR